MNASLITFTTGGISACLFLVEFVIAVFLFADSMERRASFRKRFTTGSVLAFFGTGLAVLVTQPIFGTITGQILLYLLLFLCGLLPFCLAYQSRPIALISCGISGYMTQHIASQPMQIFWNSEQMQLHELAFSQAAVFLLTEIFVYLAVYLLVWHFFAKPGRSAPFSAKADRSFLSLAVITLAVVLILSAVRDHYAGESIALMVVSRFFSVFCCFFLLYLRSGILARVVWDSQLDTMRRLREQEREHFTERRETIELINQKCHDMRHQIELWEHRGGVTNSQELERMKELINIYDASIRTGNETLDTLLSEKNLQCAQRGIDLCVIADGRSLSFMSEADLCSLFGNAMENAVEAVSRIPERERRRISLRLEERHGLLVLSMDNPYVGEIRMDGDLPHTSKDDVGYHGYGVRSMRMIAEKYGGQLSVEIGELFRIGVIIPIPAQ